MDYADHIAMMMSRLSGNDEEVKMTRDPNLPTYMHLYVGSGRATLAIQKMDTDVFRVGVAFCAPSDAYKRSTGRMKALGRVFQNAAPNTEMAFTIHVNAGERIKERAVEEFKTFIKTTYDFESKAGRSPLGRPLRIPMWVWTYFPGGPHKLNVSGRMPRTVNTPPQAA